MNEIFEGVEALTFDCYGTIVDWETGILDALEAILDGPGARPSDDALLTMYGRFESEAQRGAFRSYREVLQEVARRYGEELGIDVDEATAGQFAGSVGRWPAFPDSVEALQALGQRYRLAIVSNVDDDLFRRTATALGIDFDEVVTAQQVRSYKPDRVHFDEALRRLARPKDGVVHVAQSLFHDVAPAKELGLTCVWVHRRSGREGGGATPPAEAVPDLVVPDLASLVREAVGGQDA